MTTNGLSLDLDPRGGLASASIIYRLSKCSGSLALANYVRRAGYFVPRNRWARAGEIIHQALALQVTASSARAIKDYLDKLSDEAREITGACAELRGCLVNQWMAERPDSRSEDYSFLAERRLWYRVDEIPRFSGQPDLIALDRPGKRALLLDFKTGRTEVEAAADNMQLRTLAVLLKYVLPELEEIQGAIVEPLVSWSSERVQYSGDAFREAEKEILSIVDQATWKSKERHAGEWCAHCPGRVYCREALDYVQQIPSFPAQGAVSSGPDGESKISFDLEAMFRDLPRGERGSSLWRRLKFAEKLLDAIQATYEQILSTEPDALPGFILPEHGKQRRQVVDPQKLKAALFDIMTPEEVDGCADYCISQIEKHYRIKFDVTQQIAKKAIADLTSDVVVVTNDKPSIRPLTRKEKELKALTP